MNEFAADHGRRRSRAAIAAGIASGAARGVGMLVSLAVVPLALAHLGRADFGVWATLTSFLAMLSFADLGIANGVLTEVARASGRDDRAAIVETIRAGIAVTTCVACIVAVVALIAVPRLDWPRLLGAKGCDPVAVRHAAAALLALFAVALPLGLVAKIRLGLQQGHVSALYDALGAVASLVGVAACAARGLGLAWFVAAAAGGPVLAAAANALALRRSEPWLRLGGARTDLATCARLIRVGALYLVLQAAAAAAYSSDLIILAHVRDQDDVATYAILYRLFAIPMVATNVLVLPLWGAYGEAIARGDRAWVLATLRRSLAAAAATALSAGVALALGGEWLVRVWTGRSYEYPAALRWGLAAFLLLSTVGNAVAMLLNAAHVVAFQAVTSIAMAAAALVLKWQLGLRWGGAGVIWGLDIAFIVFLGLPWIAWLPRLLRRRLPERNTACL